MIIVENNNCIVVCRIKEKGFLSLWGSLLGFASRQEVLLKMPMPTAKFGNNI